jgi:hypothetical protein
MQRTFHVKIPKKWKIHIYTKFRCRVFHIMKVNDFFWYSRSPSKNTREPILLIISRFHRDLLIAEVCIQGSAVIVFRNWNQSLVVHIMRFTAFQEIQLNPGMRDIWDIVDCRWAKPIHRATITHTGHISWCGCHRTHTLNVCLSVYLLYLPNLLNLLYLSWLGLIDFPGKHWSSHFGSSIFPNFGLVS